MLYRLADEFVVLRQVEDGSRGPGVGQLDHRLRHQAHQEVRFLDLKDVPGEEKIAVL